MGRVSILGLEISNYRSIVGKQTIVFPESGISKIGGINRDSGGSSGSGKTTIGSAIAYALGYSKLPATTLQSWLTEEPLSVTIRLRVNDSTVEITRGSKLAIVIDGQKVRGNAATLEAKIEELLGTDPSTCAALTYRPQKTPSLFLSLPDSKKKEFLSSVMGLDRYDDIVAKAEVKAHGLDVKLGVVALQLADKQIPPEPIAPTLASVDSAAISHAEAEVSKAYRGLLAIKDGTDTETNRLDTLIVAAGIFQKPRPTKKFIDEGDLAARIKMLGDKMAADGAAHTAELNSLNGNIAELRKQESKLIYELAHTSQLLGVLPGILDSIGQIEAQTCPTCQQVWADALAAKRLAELRAEAQSGQSLAAHKKALDASLRGIQKSMEQFRLECAAKTKEWEIDSHTLVTAQSALSAKLSTLRIQADADHCRELADWEKASAQHRSSVQALEATKLAIFTKATKDNYDARLRLSALTDAAKEAQHANDLATQRYELEAKHYSAALEAHELALQSKKNIEAELAVYLDIVALVGRGGFLGLIFDEILAEIADQTNDILVRLPNVQDVVLSWTTERMTGTGNIKRDIKPTLHKNGREIPYAALSGGQATSIDLAVDAAIGRVVARRQGVDLRWLFLDEAFDGMDSIVKEQAGETLAMLANDRLVMIVDHATELNEMATHRILATYLNGVTTLESL